jgi:hypothetical protein
MNEHHSVRRQGARRQVVLLALVGIAGIVLVAYLLLRPAIANVFAGVSVKDCTWRGTAQAWVDANHDGVRAADEQPLPGVKFYVDDVQNNFVRVTTATTDAKGAADLYLFIAGCPDHKMVVYPEVPKRYCLTTPERQEDSDSNSYMFGFAAC